MIWLFNTWCYILMIFSMLKNFELKRHISNYIFISQNGGIQKGFFPLLFCAVEHWHLLKASKADICVRKFYHSDNPPLIKVSQSVIPADSVTNLAIYPTMNSSPSTVARSLSSNYINGIYLFLLFLNVAKVLYLCNWENSHCWITAWW